jgi:hypothetical protein
MSEQEMHLAKSDNAHIDKRFDEIMTELRKINGAFPRDDDGEVDHEGHRKYHESLIRAAEAQEQFWRDIRMDVAKKGIWAGIIILLGLLVVGLQIKLGLYSGGGVGGS